jgi:heat shock gene repressor HrcA
MSGAELSRRAQKILHAVVTEYLHGGDPVGSRTVTRRHDLKLSPATVRNVMADLEELGLLEQRHSSAGRVPTASGLRFFINELLKVRGLSAREKDETSRSMPRSSSRPIPITSGWGTSSSCRCATASSSRSWSPPTAPSRTG